MGDDSLSKSTAKNSHRLPNQEQSAPGQYGREQTRRNDENDGTSHVVVHRGFWIPKVANPEIRHKLAIPPNRPNKAPLNGAGCSCFAPSRVRTGKESVLA